MRSLTESIARLLSWISSKSRPGSMLSVNQRLGFNGTHFDNPKSLAALASREVAPVFRRCFLSPFQGNELGVLARIPSHSRNSAHCADVPQRFGRPKSHCRTR